MQSKVAIVYLVIVGVIVQTSAQCQLKQPMDGYNPDLVKGKFYLVQVEKAFSYQEMEAKCGTSEIDDASPQTFPYVITFQDNNESLQTIKLSVENISPPGTYNVTAGDGTKFETVVLGAIQDKVHIFYACNPKNDKEATWVYYYKRVNSGKEMDEDSRNYAEQTLLKNKISLAAIKDIDNENCKN